MSDDKVSSAASSLFDLRTVIAILFGFYGVVLTIMGIVTATPENTAKSGGSTSTCGPGSGCSSSRPSSWCGRA